MAVGAVAFLPSTQALGAIRRIDKIENFSRREIHLTHGSPVISKINSSSVGIWIRLAPMKWKRDIDEVRLRLEITSSKDKKPIVRKRLIALRDEAFIVRHTFRAQPKAKAYFANVYFSDELIAQKAFFI